MRKILSVVAAAWACGVAAEGIAQPVSLDRVQVSTAASRKMVDACVTFAEKNNSTFAVAIVDLGGHLIEYHRMEGASATTGETAMLKAKTAAHWGRSTAVLEDTMLKGGTKAPLWIGDFPKGGALPIMIDGQVAGAIGVGGGGTFQEACAQAGLDAVIPKAPATAAR